MKTLKGMALSMLGLIAAILLCALAVSEEMDERSEQECRKIKRVAYHTNEWRDAR